jgi:hypothetical protein
VESHSFGAAASHLAARLRTWDVPLPVSIFGPEGGIIPQSAPATNEPAPPERLTQLLATLRAQITLSDAIRRMSLMPAERLGKLTADAHGSKDFRRALGLTAGPAPVPGG